MNEFAHQHPVTSAFLILAIIFGSFLTYLAANVYNANSIASCLGGAFLAAVSFALTIAAVVAAGVTFCLGY